MVLKSDDDKSSKNKLQHFPKSVNLPFYDDDHVQDASKSSPPRSTISTTIESYVRRTRMEVITVGTSVKRFNENITSKYVGVKDRTQKAIAFFQNEPELWQRCTIVALAGLTGVISGYRSSAAVKSRNMLLASGVAASVCWPRQTVEVVSDGYKFVKQPLSQFWKEYAAGSSYHPKNTAVMPPKNFYNHRAVVEEDHGQSKTEDKDMYSTRGS